MSSISDVYCFIDTKNQTNKCKDNNYKIINDNNKINKVNHNNSLDVTNNKTNNKSKSTNNNTIQYAYANASNINNATNMNK